MNKEPWLEGLTEDWIPDRQLSISAGGSILTSSGRPDDDFKAPDRGHYQNSREFCDNIDASKTPDPVSRDCQSEMTSSAYVQRSSHVPIPTERDSHANSDRFLQSQTIQTKAGHSGISDTPEWKRRILQGEGTAGGNIDLFAPIGLEKIFKPPTDDKSPRPTNQTPYPNKRPETPDSMKNNEQMFTSASNMSTPSPDPPMQDQSATPYKHGRAEPDSRAADYGTTEPLKQDTSGLDRGNDTGPGEDARMRTASGVEELRNEGISPIPPPTDDSGLEKVDSESFSSIHITRDFYNKQTLGASDGHDSPNREQTDAVEASLEMTSQSLPEGLSMGTQDVSSVGGFVNMRRGGYSEEGSFLVRRLSPSSMPSQLLSSSQMWSSPSQSGKQRGTLHYSQPVTRRPATSSDIPSAGTRFHNSERLSDENLGRSGGPLRLFANHDTFTNDRLLRRMGQFEGSLEYEVDGKSKQKTNAQNEASRGQAPSMSHSSKAEVEDSGGRKRNYSHDTEGVTKMTESEQSKQHQQGASQAEDIERCSKPKATEWLKRQKPHYAEPKRGRNSPTKDSSPKRRRKLRDSDNHDYMWHEPLLDSSEFVSRNEPEESSEDGLQAEELSPEEPSAGQSASTALHSGSPHKTKSASSRPSSRRFENGGSRPGTSQRPHESKEAGLGHAVHESRKGSITTQDFLDEATKIMNFIRSRGRIKNDLASVPEAEVGNRDEPYSDESSEEEFSRPPSREVAKLPRLRVPHAPNPRIVSHLKKFEDNDELDMFMGASAMSLRLRKVSGSPRDSLDDYTDADAGESSPKNIRIREAFNMLSRRHSFSGDSTGLHADNAAELQNDFSSQRPAGTIRTGFSQHSTGSSGAKGIISSDMVSHLIPGKVGKMVFDRARRRWVKGDQGSGEATPVLGDMSEEDPFNDIPDLSVDELQELINARDFVANGGVVEQAGQQDGSNEEGGENKSQTESRPITREGQSSVHSKSTRFTGSQPKPDTRATSWATDDFDQVITKPSDANEVSTTTGRAGEAQHESRVHDGHVSPVPCTRQSGEKQPRVVTVNFSSPLIARSGDLAGGDDLPAQKDLPGSVSNTPANRPRPLPKLPVETPAKKDNPVSATPGRSSLRRQVLNGHPISRIEERNEGSTCQGDGELSVILTPDHGGQSAISRHGGAHPDTSYSFHLSPLADFTVNQPEDSMRLEVSYVAERTNPKSLRQVHGTFTLAAETLIKHLTDVEPFEVYWEHLRELNLRGKALITLLKLNQYCPRLEELDAADNRIGQLSGVPSTIRSLNVAGNCLSNLTAWTHLSNLQYVDVSGNELESLDGFSGLVHLRSLKANGNKITSARGVLQLDGLLSLELRDNALESVDFGGSELVRLENLDLRGNQLSRVENIDCLPVLDTLDLRDNFLRDFTPTSSFQRLRSLRLSRNRMGNLDVSSFPALRLLYVDCNCLSTVKGLDACEHLETLSMREQTCPSDERLPLTVHVDPSHTPALRKLYLSSNKLSPTILAPQSPVPSVQFLDIASCSLEHLPERFGRNFTNIKALNLNFNAITDITELEGVVRLARLSLVGNRISRLRRLCHILRDVGGKSGTLRKVDLRGNPITVGFYPAPILGSGKRLAIEGKKSRELVKSGGGAMVEDDDFGLPPLDGYADIALRAGDATTALECRRDKHRQLEDPELEIEIDDPYTIPPADPIADQKYVVHLDESTRLRRRVVELMIHAATSGRLKALDGLDLAGLEGKGRRVKKDWVWNRLEQLGVLKKRNGACLVPCDDGDELDI